MQKSEKIKTKSNEQIFMEQFKEWVVIIFILAFFIFAIVSVVYWSIRNGISPMPTSRKAKRYLLGVLPTDIKGSVYELGSGWGTLAIPLAKRYPTCLVVGYETSYLPYWFSKVRLLFSRMRNLRILRQDFFRVSLEDAGLVICYLYPGAMKMLKTKLSEELKPGTWVISNTFSIPGWHAEEILEVGDLFYTKIYIYRIKPREFLP